MDPNPSQEDLLRSLTAQARSRWGEQRAAALQTSLEAAARHLLEIGQNLPSPRTEPGFYPPLHE